MSSSSMQDFQTGMHKVGEAMSAVISEQVTKAAQAALSEKQSS